MWQSLKMGLTALVLLTGTATADDSLGDILADRPDTDKARDQYRHPKETLTLFGIKPGMTVVDALPGSFYGRILAPLVGDEGTYIGTAYPFAHYEKMFPGERMTEARKKRYNNYETNFPADVETWSAASPNTGFFRTWNAPAEMNGTVDAYLLFRALHHMNKFDGEQLDAAAVEAFRIVKPGGIVGIVQHRAPEDSDDEWARGFNGYLKQSRVIAAFKGAGFILDEASEINANRKDQPTAEDYVWRLPPTLATSDENKETNRAIGESDRMTLKFRKPS